MPVKRFLPPVPESCAARPTASRLVRGTMDQTSALALRCADGCRPPPRVPCGLPVADRCHEQGKTMLSYADSSRKRRNSTLPGCGFERCLAWACI